MKGTGKHLSATRLLVRAYWRKNKVFNLILLCTVAMVTLSSFCVFSLVQGKLNADVKSFVCTAGTTADAYVENGTEDISDEIEDLSFASHVGYEKRAGKLFTEGTPFCDCVIYEAETFQTMILPALFHMEGAYPQKCEEIMLSTKVLERLGVNEPKIGMTISLEFYWDDFTIGKLEGGQEFVLSGYFEESPNGVGGLSRAFLAKERLSKAGMTLFPCRILLETDQDYLNGSQVSQQLTSKIRLNDDQYIVANDSAEYRAMRASMGSYGMAVVFCVFLFLFLFFILYNLKLVSLESDVREFGLWKSLGVTDKEVGRIYKRRAWGIWLGGTGFGVAVGSIIVCGLFPRIIGKLYLGGLTKAGGEVIVVSAFDFRWLFISVALTGGAMAVATGVALQKMQKLSFREAVDFTEGKAAKKVNLHKLVEKKSRRNVLSELAWMNVLRSKKKFISIVCSLVLGWEIILCASVISSGIDKMNELEANPDFVIGIRQSAAMRVITMPWGMEGSGVFHDRDAEGNGLFSDQGAGGRKFFSDQDVEDLLARVKVADKVEKIRGYIPALSDEGLANMEVLNGYRDAWIIIQVFDGEDMGQLLKYAEKSMGKEDLQEVMRMGNGAFILHKNMLNGEEEKVGKKIGSEFSVSELVVGVPTSPEERATLVNCGYLNVEDEAFPRLSLAWPDDATIWLAVGEDAFDMLGEHMTVQNFAIRFNVEEGQEPTAKEVLKNWVNQANIAFLETGQPSMLELFSITCNSDAIAENETYIIGSRILMFVVSLFLVFAGIVNYTSMSMGNATSRRREFELLGNIGVTKKQIRGMLALESLIYFGTSAILILTMGNGLLFLLKDYMEGKLYYFTFHYPIEAWLGMFLLFGAISILLPQMLYRSKKSADVDVALTFKEN